jgi:phenylalanyl-tRNA synthetase beta chain
VDGADAGIAGQLRPSEAKALDLGGTLLAAELELDAELARPAAAARFQELPRFPHTTRDIALVTPLELLHGRVVEVLESAGPQVLVLDVSACVGMDFAGSAPAAWPAPAA